MIRPKRSFILASSIVLACLVILTSCAGIFIPDFYSKETANWQVQSVGQDLIDLLIVFPSLIVTAIFAYRKNNFFILLWAGVIVYLIYTFLIYCFSLHFNRLFIVYCFILGLSVYSFIYFLFSQLKQTATMEVKNPIPAKVSGIYFLIISFVFYFLWLSEIIPSILHNKTPKSVFETGLLTNPVHVIDLSVVLPGICITGILIMRKKYWGYVFAPIILSFFILMNITIGGLAVIMKIKGLQNYLSVAIVMIILFLWSGFLLVQYLKNIRFKFPSPLP